MTEEEILVRAREATIAAGYTRGLGITTTVAAADEEAIRRGYNDHNWSVLCAARAQTLPQSRLRKGWLWREIVEAAAFVIGFPVVVWLLLFI